nr:ubiquinol-cytochrome c reductase iron-sulfur subunit [Thiolinea sp.]
MANSGVDVKRRRFLVASTSVVGAAGAAALVTPFLYSMSPSARALAAGTPVEVDISKLEPGMLQLVMWRGKPVWVVNRSEEMLAALPGLDNRLKDPKSEMP